MVGEGLKALIRQYGTRIGYTLRPPLQCTVKGADGG